MDRLERKLSGPAFNASIPQPKCTEYSPPVHRFTLPAPEYRRSHVAVKFSLAEEGWREAPGWSVRPKPFANLTTPSAPIKEASRYFLKVASTPPLRAELYCHMAPPVFRGRKREVVDRW